MNTRGPSMWERYIEHAIIAVAVLVMIWFAWGSFGTKITVQIGPRTLTADSVDDELAAGTPCRQLSSDRQSRIIYS